MTQNRSYAQTSRRTIRFASVAVAALSAMIWLPAVAQNGTQNGTPDAALEHEIHADMSFLAADELHGRGSATRDEHLAAQFCAEQMEALGLQPGAPGGAFLLKAKLPPAMKERIDKGASRAARGASMQDIPRDETWDAIGVLPGSDPALKSEVVLLTAHLDHLGMMAATATPEDKIFNGADDDASGTTAVLTLMHRLATGPRPKRTVVFALFGSEELGGFGNQAFLKTPPVPLTSIVANLEFEMMGRPDALVPEGTLWLTGFERSNLGPELAKHGAHIVGDPHPKEQFFQRSDNFALAKQGIIAQTVSSYGLHTDYHAPSDDLAHIDFAHMLTAIRSMEAPIDWLVNTDWKPSWNANGKP